MPLLVEAKPCLLPRLWPLFAVIFQALAQEDDVFNLNPAGKVAWLFFQPRKQPSVRTPPIDSLNKILAVGINSEV